MTVQLHLGDCVESMRAMLAASVDSIVCDPPYELGFMGKTWDASGIAYSVEMWAEALRVLKPGGHLLAFSGARTYHRMVCAVEDAGFEIRDQIMWVYGSGFPKSLNVAKAIDTGGRPEDIRRAAMGAGYVPSGRGRENYDHGGASAMNGEVASPEPSEAARQWQGWGTALKPAHEPIVVARKPLIGTVAANVRQFGTGALNIGECRIPTSENLNGGAYAEQGGRAVSGSLSASGMNVPGKTVGDAFVQPTGRWPANLIHDGSEEVVALFPETSSGVMKAGTVRAAQDGPGSVCFGTFGGNASDSDTFGDTGSAARFFYCSKASSEDRHEGLPHPGVQFKKGSTLRDAENVGAARGGNHHPTVKPTDLMRYLCRLVTPPGGVVLDPFMGSGSTGRAAVLEGFRFIGCELSPEYLEIARARIDFARRQGHQPSLLESAA